MARFVVEIDRKACQGFGACVEFCPQFYKLSETDRKNTVVKNSEKIKEGEKVVREVFETDELECALQGAEACPFKAINVNDKEKNLRLI